MMRIVVALCFVGVAAVAVHAADDSGWAGGSARSCLGCHSDLAENPTAHPELPDMPGAGNSCESCHGPSAAHFVVGADGRRPPPPGPTDATCTACHQEVGALRWPHSPHAQADLSCTACHTIHTARDAAVADCTTCHQDVRAALHRPSSHPVLDGAMACTDCHDPHGGRGDAALVRDSVNETCYMCHADLRGPFLWEHPPVREDCSTCHLPHGSVNENLLNARTPYLCQQCHLAQFHPSTALSGTGVPPTGASASLLLRDCASCHTQVHGSNHPSGARQTR